MMHLSGYFPPLSTEESRNNSVVRMSSLQLVNPKYRFPTKGIHGQMAEPGTELRITHNKARDADSKDHLLESCEKIPEST